MKEKGRCEKWRRGKMWKFGQEKRKVKEAERKRLKRMMGRCT
jgi:hypothetical protein